MKDLLLHEGLMGSVRFSTEDDCFFGKIEGIDDLVTFEGRTVDEIKRAFQEAVHDYKRLCEEVGKPMQKSYKGSFNVRISPELHKKAVRKSLAQGISLNQFVQTAIEESVKDQPGK